MKLIDIPDKMLDLIEQEAYKQMDIDCGQLRVDIHQKVDKEIDKLISIYAMKVRMAFSGKYRLVKIKDKE